MDSINTENCGAVLIGIINPGSSTVFPCNSIRELGKLSLPFEEEVPLARARVFHVWVSSWVWP
jgi:hypothetical protein